MTNKQDGVVVAVDGLIAKVKTSRHNNCENCGACPGNSAIVLDAQNPVGAKAGQRVEIEIREAGMLKAAFVVFLLPLMAVFAGVMAAGYVAEGEEESQIIQNSTNREIQISISEAKAKAENERKAELKATKEARKAEVDEAMNKAFELCKQFIKDYGTYETKHHLISNFKGKDILTPSLTDCFSFFNDLLYF